MSKLLVWASRSQYFGVSPVNINPTPYGGLIILCRGSIFQGGNVDLRLLGYILLDIQHFNVSK